MNTVFFFDDPFVSHIIQAYSKKKKKNPTAHVVRVIERRRHILRSCRQDIDVWTRYICNVYQDSIECVERFKI